MAACVCGGDGTYGGAAVAGEPSKSPYGACAAPDSSDADAAAPSETGSGSSDICAR